MTSEEIIEFCQDADFIIAGTEKFEAKTLARLPKLKIISRVGVGTDSIDLVHANKNGIVVCTTPIAPVPAVAEHTLAMILSLCKNIPNYISHKINDSIPITPGCMLRGKRAGIIGLGRVGIEVARLLNCLGMSIQYYDPFIKVIPDEPWECASSLLELVQTSDIISLHNPPLKDNKPILTRGLFQEIKTGVIIVNTARGSLIDEQALIVALNEGRVRAAGLDVTSTEPYVGPLRNYEQVLITPHIASNTYESRREMEVEAINNILKFTRSAL
jgi:D-3-phosphoglycerate dehydrogenase